MVLQEGAVFAERYRLLKLLGRGGFSEVWLAEDTMSRLQVAIKIYAPYGGLDDDGAQLFSNEFALVFNINHTNLLKPTHFDSYERSPYLILPFCSKGSTDSLVGCTNEETAWDILHDVSAGLACLHSQEPPIIHQDIKPDNILINDHGDYLITDFGISTKIRSTLRRSVAERESTSSGGTYAYMGPERFSRQPAPVKASDIWSLGAMIFELLEGRPPFDNLGGAMQKNGADIPEIQAPVSKTLKQAVYACLAPQPWDRPTAETVYSWARSIKEGKTIKVGGKGKIAEKKHTAKKINPDGDNGKGKTVRLLIGIAAAVLVIFGIFAAGRKFSDAKDYRDYKDLADSARAIAQSEDPYDNTYEEGIFQYNQAISLCQKHNSDNRFSEDDMYKEQQDLIKKIDKACGYLKEDAEVNEDNYSTYGLEDKAFAKEQISEAVDFYKKAHSLYMAVSKSKSLDVVESNNYEKNARAIEQKISFCESKLTELQ